MRQRWELPGGFDVRQYGGPGRRHCRSESVRKTRPVICPVTGGYPLHLSRPVAPVETAPGRTLRMIVLVPDAAGSSSGRRSQIDGSGSHGAGPRAAPGAPNARPDRPTRCRGSTLKTASGAVPVEISLISAVRTYALCVHTQEPLGGGRRPACRHETPAHRPPTSRTPCVGMRTAR